PPPTGPGGPAPGEPGAPSFGTGPTSEGLWTCFVALDCTGAAAQFGNRAVWQTGSCHSPTGSSPPGRPTGPSPSVSAKPECSAPSGRRWSPGQPRDAPVVSTSPTP